MYMELNERQQAFIRALRSGEFTQGKNSLTNMSRDIEKDCCLGVACKLARYFILELEWNLKPYSDVVYTWRAGIDKGFQAAHPIWSESSVLPPPVVKWFGFYNQNPIIDLGLGFMCKDLGLGQSDSQYISLTALNDSTFTFPMIADMVEYFADQVFVKA